MSFGLFVKYFGKLNVFNALIGFFAYQTKSQTAGTVISYIILQKLLLVNTAFWWEKIGTV